MRTTCCFAECAPPGEAEWEVVVVENGSSDDTAGDTARVLESFDGVLPLRTVAEATPGLSHARNAAVRAARGAYVVWTDDDCVVDRQWLAAYAAAFAQWPNAALFGGPIVPRFEGEPPAWLTRTASRVGTAFAARDLGREPVALSLADDRVPFGANYAIRLAEQRGRLYDHRLGRGAKRSIAVGEESEVLEALLREGATGRWVPDARVTHTIPPSRQRVSYLRDYFLADGAYEEWRCRDSRSSSTAKLIRRAVTAELRYQIIRRVARADVWIEHLIAASVARGRLRTRFSALGPRQSV